VTPMTESPLRQSLHTLLSDAIAATSSTLGYDIAAITFGEAIEVTLDKAGATFVLWLKSAGDTTACFKSTKLFKIGHRGDPPDRLGYTLLTHLSTTLEEWERTLPARAEQELFAPRAAAVAISSNAMSQNLDPAAAAALAQATCSPIYDDWLPAREQDLTDRLRALTVRGARKILLLNATKGLQFYPSIVDFFTRLQRLHPSMQVTAASYFDTIFQFQEEVRRKGLPVVTTAELATWDVAALNGFDIILMIGPSDLTAALMAMKGLKAKLLLLDLGFYHQLIEAYPTAFYDDGEMIRNQRSQINAVTGYTCQPLDKLENDFRRACALPLLQWRWFDYIPIGFNYCRYYRATAPAFDVALLGSAGREYGSIDHHLFRGLRFLFIGSPNHAPEIQRLRQHLDVTIASGLDQETYNKLLAVSRCVLLPARPDVRNVFLSVLDAIAAGRPLVTSRHTGIARMADHHLPAVFYDTTSTDLFAKTRDLLGDRGRLADIEARSIAFTKENLDIYRILWTILEEQVL